MGYVPPHYSVIEEYPLTLRSSYHSPDYAYQCGAPPPPPAVDPSAVFPPPAQEQLPALPELRQMPVVQQAAVVAPPVVAQPEAKKPRRQPPPPKSSSPLASTQTVLAPAPFLSAAGRALVGLHRTHAELLESDAALAAARLAAVANGDDDDGDTVVEEGNVARSVSAPEDDGSTTTTTTVPRSPSAPAVLARGPRVRSVELDSDDLERNASKAAWRTRDTLLDKVLREHGKTVKSDDAYMEQLCRDFIRRIRDGATRKRAEREIETAGRAFLARSEMLTDAEINALWCAKPLAKVRAAPKAPRKNTTSKRAVVKPMSVEQNSPSPRKNIGGVPATGVGLADDGEYDTDGEEAYEARLRKHLNRVFSECVDAMAARGKVGRLEIVVMLANGAGWGSRLLDAMILMEARDAALVHSV